MKETYLAREAGCNDVNGGVSEVLPHLSSIQGGDVSVNGGCWQVSIAHSGLQDVMAEGVDFAVQLCVGDAGNGKVKSCDATEQGDCIHVYSA